jgi:glutaredoxin
MKTLTIYSTPVCSQCRQAKEYLTEVGVPFTDVNLHENSEALLFIRKQGHRSVPQIYLGEQQFVNSWTELRQMSVDEINQKING